MIKKLLALIVVAGVGSAIYFMPNYYNASFNYAGTIEATRIDMPARIATVLDSILVNEGENVQAGQKLAQLACDEQEIAFNLANDNFKRAEKLLHSGSVPREAFEQIASRKRETEIRLSWCSIVAPLNATVLTKYVESKEWVNPGSKVLTIADLENLWTYFYVPAEVMAKLNIGSKVIGIIPELGNRTFTGILTKVNDQAEFTPKNVQTRAERTRLVFGVKVSFKNSEGLLKPGMTIESTLAESA